jgi:opacity protein-like surface antigen
MEITAMKRTTLACLCALAASPAAAQDGGWNFSATGYLWLPATKTTADTAFGEVESTLSASDAISDLEFGFMGSVAAQRDRWSLIGDLIYTDVSVNSSTPRGLLFEKGRIDTEVTIVSGFAAYRVAETEQAAFDIAGGFRLFSVDVDGRLQNAALPTENFGGSETWVVPLIGARAIFPFADRWTGTFSGDFGGTGSDDQTWQALGRLDYAINENWSAVLAYRYLTFDKSIGGSDTTIEMYGPALGVSYRF